MVQSKADRERQKLITDKCQALIEVLLKDEDNKYCVDCDAKGPRWASWNLGIFLCIRCAGIHRNLGVHISRVKSVNLDAWTPEHVAYVQRMGNSRARAIYEANLPDDFRRPQTDVALESFIRAKYEHKKYIDPDYIDPGPPEPAFNVDEELKRMKEQKKSKSTVGGSNKPMISVSELSLTSHKLARQNKPSKQDGGVGGASNNNKTVNIGSLSLESKAAAPTKANKSALADLIDLDLGFGASSAGANTSTITGLNNSFTLTGNSDLFDNSFDSGFAPTTKGAQQAATTGTKGSNLASLADLLNPAFSATQSQHPLTSTNLSQRIKPTTAAMSPFASATTATNSPFDSIPSSQTAMFATTATPLGNTNLVSKADVLDTIPKATGPSEKNVFDLLDL